MVRLASPSRRGGGCGPRPGPERPGRPLGAHHRDGEHRASSHGIQSEPSGHHYHPVASVMTCDSSETRKLPVTPSPTVTVGTELAAAAPGRPGPGPGGGPLGKPQWQAQCCRRLPLRQRFQVFTESRWFLHPVERHRGLIVAPVSSLHPVTVVTWLSHVHVAGCTSLPGYSTRRILTSSASICAGCTPLPGFHSG